MSTVDEKAIWQLVQTINACWQNGRAEELAKCFHPNMVLAGPELELLCHGREACVASYIDFCSRSRILDFSELMPDVNVYEDTAVAAYAFTIQYEQDSATKADTGRDVFVFNRKDGNWQVVWRAVYFDPKS